MPIERYDPIRAVEHEYWWPHVADVVTAGARNPDEAMNWLMWITDLSAMFDNCHRTPPNMVSFDAKVRSAIGVRLIGDSNGKHAKLAMEIKRTREELWHATPPK